jgi:hypothetical protein
MTGHSHIYHVYHPVKEPTQWRLSKRQRRKERAKNHRLWVEANEAAWEDSGESDRWLSPAEKALAHGARADDAEAD